MAFDYTAAIRAALELIQAEAPLFAHVDVDRVAVSFAQTRNRSQWGTFAKMLPLRFEGGARETVEGRRTYRAEDFTFRGREVLYILYVYLPRFHDQRMGDKLLTLFHELYHISPAFDGDLRRFPGPNPFHGASREAFDASLRPHREEFLDRHGSSPALDFLREPLEVLEERHGGISGTWIQMPTFHPVR